MIKRMQQVYWLLQYLPDIESDMSAFHRIDDIYSMEAARFFRLATRLPAYKGVMRALMEAEVAAERRKAEGVGRDGKPEPIPLHDPQQLTAALAGTGLRGGDADGRALIDFG